MFGYIKRLVIALESIATNITEMRADNKAMIERANTQNPNQLEEMFKQVQKVIGGKKQ